RAKETNGSSRITPERSAESARTKRGGRVIRSDAGVNANRAGSDGRLGGADQSRRRQAETGNAAEATPQRREIAVQPVIQVRPRRTTVSPPSRKRSGVIVACTPNGPERRV